MKHIIILGDGMADHPIQRLGGLTPLQYADTPYMDRIAREGKTGRLVTIPDGFQPGSEVANTAILGYDLQGITDTAGHHACIKDRCCCRNDCRHRWMLK